MKKMIGAMAVAAGLMAISVFPAYAEETALTPGVSVNADENSPTGYTVTFVYENPEAQSVSVAGNFAFYLPGSRVAAIPPEDRRISTGEFEEGMFRANSTDLAIYEEMEKRRMATFGQFLLHCLADIILTIIMWTERKKVLWIQRIRL